MLRSASSLQILVIATNVIPGRSTASSSSSSSAAAALLAPGAAPAPTPGPPVTVSVPSLGQVVGAQDVSGSPGVAGFGNIPYASPPVGPLRWQPPAAHGPWASPRNARSFGKTCWQPGCTAANDACSEDCLSLNVYAPMSHLTRNASTPKLPTVLWVHGGGFLSGSGMYYRGDTFVLSAMQTGNPAVYVCINYRLGVLTPLNIF
jgi:para-nitrobenzyl esterase